MSLLFSFVLVLKTRPRRAIGFLFSSDAAPTAEDAPVAAGGRLMCEAGCRAEGKEPDRGLSANAGWEDEVCPDVEVDEEEAAFEAFERLLLDEDEDEDVEEEDEEVVEAEAEEVEKPKKVLLRRSSDWMVVTERALKVRMDWRELVLSSMVLMVMTALSIVSRTSEDACVWSLGRWLQIAHLSIFSLTSVPTLMKPLHRKPSLSHFLHVPCWAILPSIDWMGCD